MSELIPLFPLPGVVLFPGAELPLHIFEPRYRDMVRYALHGRLPIGMVLLRPGYERDYEGAPAIREVGCAGEIRRCDPLPDGRYNLVLRGLYRFRVGEEDRALAFRRACPLRLPELAPDAAQEALEPRIKRDLLGDFLALGAALQGRRVEGAPVAPEIPLGELVSLLAFAWPGDPGRKQDLLEIDGALERALRLRAWLAADLRRARGEAAAEHPYAAEDDPPN